MIRFHSDVLFVAVLLISFFVAFGTKANDEVSKHIAVVAPQPFHQTLERWIEYRTQQGYTVHVIVEPFQSQTTTPQRVKERIANQNRETPLSALLIIGKTTPSPLIPCRIIQNFGEEKDLASDDWYADLNNDGLADFSVGRLPVAIPDNQKNELQTLIEKIIEYEKQPPNVWTRHLQLVAGTGNFSPILDSVIESAARHIISETLPAGYDLSLLQIDWQSRYCPFPLDTPLALRLSLDQSLFWVYAGHARPGVIDSLNTPSGYVPLSLKRDGNTPHHADQPLSVALLLCCYGGYLDAPPKNNEKNNAAKSLAEQILDDHFVAAIAPSRTAMPYGMSVFGIEMLQTFARYQNESKPLTLGQLIWESKYRMLNPPKAVQGQRTVRGTVDSTAAMFDPNPQQLHIQLEEHGALFHLFGDPLLQLPIPQHIELQCPKRIHAGEMLRIIGRVSEHFDGQSVICELVLPLNQLTLRSTKRREFHNTQETREEYNKEYLQANRQVILSAPPQPIKNGHFNNTFILPNNLKGTYSIRAFVKSEKSFAVGSCTFRCAEPPTQKTSQKPQ